MEAVAIHQHRDASYVINGELDKLAAPAGTNSVTSRANSTAYAIAVTVPI